MTTPTTLPPADTILALPPGPELDALVLEHVLGWAWVENWCGDARYLTDPAAPITLPMKRADMALPVVAGHFDHLERRWPQPSRNWGDAGRVLDWFAASHAGMVNLGPIPDGAWIAKCDREVVVDTESGPAALCRLALLVVARERQGKEVSGA